VWTSSLRGSAADQSIKACDRIHRRARYAQVPPSPGECLSRGEVLEQHGVSKGDPPGPGGRTGCVATCLWNIRQATTKARAASAAQRCALRRMVRTPGPTKSGVLQEGGTPRALSPSRLRYVPGCRMRCGACGTRPEKNRPEIVGLLPGARAGHRLLVIRLLRCPRYAPTLTGERATSSSIWTVAGAAEARKRVQGIPRR